LQARAGEGFARQAEREEMYTILRKAVVLVAVGVLLASCSSGGKQQASKDPFAGKGSPHYSGKGAVPWGGGRYHVGKPYQVAGRWFTPKEDPDYDKKGTASWYGEAFNRRKTSNGEWFDMTRLTAAHPTLPLPSYVKVTNLENGREVVVRVNDRGPFVGTRIIDLSKRTAEVLEFKHKGKAHVRVQFIGPAPLNDNGSHLMAMNKELDRGTPLRKMIAKADRRKGKAPAEEVQTAAAKPKKKAPPPEPEMEVAAVPEPQLETASYEPEAAPQMVVTYFVQLGSFSDAENAARVRDSFAAVWPVQFIELSGAAGPVYRVRLGPISTTADAETALIDAQSAGFGDARMIRNESVQASLE
jgi:rare lipoprotein A